MGRKIKKIFKSFINVSSWNIKTIYITDKYASAFGSATHYAYYHDEDESTFHLVDTTRVQKPPYQRGRFRGANQRNARGRGGKAGLQTGMQALGKGAKARESYKRREIKRWGQGRVSFRFDKMLLSLRSILFHLYKGYIVLVKSYLAYFFNDYFIWCLC